MDCLVRTARRTWIESDSGLLQCKARTCANAAADDHIGVIRHEKARQRAVLTRRSAEVERLYIQPCDADVIVATQFEPTTTVST